MGNQWTKIGKDFNNLGTIADLDEKGETIVIGDPDLNTEYGTNAGAVYVYEDKGDKWVQKGQTLFGDSKMIHFGHSVSISNDGNSVIVGVPFYDNDEDQFAGVSKVYKFDHSYNLWFHVGNIIMGKARREMAGHSVRICNNGNRIAITIPKRLEENGRILSYVEVYEYKNTDPADKYNGTWELFGQPIKVKSDFGNRISINEDGTIIAVSFLPRNGDGESVKTFKYDPTIDDWEAMGQPIKVKRSTNETPYPVALSSDGETLVVSLADRGEAIVYKFNGDIWKDIHHIQNLNISDQYDASVSISSNGEKILIGAPVHNKNKNNKNTGNISVWSINEKNKLSKMKVDNEGGILNGSNNIVSISNDGNRFIVGNSEQRSFRMYRWS